MPETPRPGPQDTRPPDTRSPFQKAMEMFTRFRERMGDFNRAATSDMQEIVTRGNPDARQTAAETLTELSKVRTKIGNGSTPPPTQPKP